jgi:hypothetical protein
VVSPGLANAVVPSGLKEGQYDLIVVNPDGAVGFLPAAYTVTKDSPPLVDVITPGSIPGSAAQRVIVRGSGFVNPVVRLDCLDPAGASTTKAVPITNASGTTIETSVPGDQIGAGSICLLVVTNPDGSYAEFAALGVTNPAENLGAFKAESSMGTPRRASATAAARPTRSARFLYAFGGDNGAASGALSSAEVAPLDRFGNLGSFRALPLALPGHRTLAAAQTVGRFIYLVGGNDGAGPKSTVHRGAVLRPSDAPDFTDLLLELNSAGLAPGLWFYRVSAVMSALDPDNPGGETLPSDPLAVQVPTGLPEPLRATLTWSAVPGAASYRVYRTATPGAAAGSAVLLATVSAPATQLVDSGSATSLQKPLQIGDLGVWKTMPSLTTHREGFGLSLGQDPSDSKKSYLYAIGGRTLVLVTPTALRTHETLTIATAANGSQTTGAFWSESATNLLSTGRWQVGALTVTDVATTRIPTGDTWIHVGPGRKGDDTGFVNDVEAARVQTGGTLTTWVSEASPNNFAGYGFAAAANQLFIFGGQGTAPSTSGRSGQLCGTGGSCAGPPGLANFNAGISLSVPRHFPGSAVESARIFMIGGTTTGGVPTATVESTIW